MVDNLLQPDLELRTLIKQIEVKGINPQITRITQIKQEF